MNHIYRLVSNRALGVVQVVSELAGASPGGRNAAATLGLRRTPLALACAGLLGMAAVVASMPASAADIVIPTTSTPGDFSEDTAGPGNISQTGSITVGGTTSLVADGTILLTNAGNDFIGAVNLSAGATQITDQNALMLGMLDTGALTVVGTGALNLGSGTIGGNLVATSNDGAIGQSGALQVSGGSTINAGSGAITLTNAGNDFVGAVTATGNGIAITGANSLTAASLTATGSGNVNLSAGGSLSAGSILTGGGNVTLAAAGGVDTGGINAGTGNMTLASNGGALTVNGALDGTNASLTSADGLTLNGDVVAAGTLTLHSVNAGIAQTAGSLAIAGVTNATAGGAIILTSVGNDFGGPVNLSAGGLAQITDSNALVLGSITAQGLVATSFGALGLGSGFINGNLSANSNGGAINQTGALFVAGTSLLDAGSGSIALTSAGNDFQGAVSATGASIAITDANDLSIASLNNDLNGSVSLIAGGALTLPAGSIATGTGNLTLAANGGALSASGALSGNSVSLTGRDGVILGGDVSATGTLALASTNAAIMQLAGSITTAGISLFDAGTGNIALTSAGNDFTGAVSLAGGNTQITDSNALMLGTLDTGTLTAVSHGALNLGTGSIGGNLMATSNGGAITQPGMLAVSGNSTFDAGAGAITLANAGNDFIGTVSLTGGSTQITDANALSLGSLNTGALIATSHGALNLGTGSINGNLDTTSNGGAISQSGALTVLGASMFDAGTGDITLAYVNNNFVGAIDATGANIAIASFDNLTTASVTGTGGVTLSTNIGNLTLGGDVVAPGTLTVFSSDGAITQTGGTITAGILQGQTSGAVVLTNAGNHVVELRNFSATSFSLTDAQALAITGSLDIANTLSLDDSSGIIVTGAIDAGTTTFGAGTTLRIGNGSTTGSISGNVVDNGILAFDRSDALTFAGSIAGSGSLQQLGSGALILDGDSSAFAGSTDVLSGSLIVGGTAGSGAVLGGDVDVASGATLGGHGSIGGDVSLAGGAHLAPGNSIGTLTIGGDLALAQGSVLDFEFGAPGVDFATFGSSDSVAVAGDLSLGGAVLNVTDAGGMGPGLYNLFNWGGTLSQSNGGLVFGTLPAGNFQLQTLTGDKQINLIDSTGMTLNFWNGNGLASATQLGGGDGTWSTASMTWTDATGSITAAMHPQPGFAIFGGAAGAVTIDNGSGAVSATGMQFASDGYALSGDALTLVADSGATPVIRVGDGSAAGADMTASIGNVIAGSDGLLKTDLGTLVLTGANTYSGGTAVNGGVLSVSNDGNLGDASGGLMLDGGTLRVTGTTFTGTARDIELGASGGGFDIADASNIFTVTQALEGNGALDKDGLGTLLLSGNNRYSGGTTIDAGTLQIGDGGTSGSIVGDVVDNGMFAFDRSDAITFAGAISGSGALVQQGSGMLTLDGNSSAFTGNTDVQSGSVIVGSVAGNGAALGGDVAVASGATLGGHGSIGGDVVNAGTLAPGASIGTLTIHGDYTQTTTGILAIEADASGRADLLVVDGVATLDGSTLVLAQAGNWMPRTDYTILTAGGGVSGEFDSATSSLLFLDPILGYGANAVTLSLQRNDTAFASAARTRNQRATAAAADGLDWGNAAYVALTTLDADSAPLAFDALSGEVHASARTALLDDSRYLREAVNQHLRATGNGAAGAWTAAWGHWARSDSDGNADAMRGDALGFAIGADLAIADQARVGAVIGSGQLTTRADARASVVDIDSRHLGLYGSLQAGGLLLQGGVAHSRQQAGSKRVIAFDGYNDLAQADYDARTTQVYLGGSHAFAFSRGSLAPFLNLAQVKVRSEAFDETGGDAALHVDAASSERTYATVGARWTAAFGSQDAVQWQGSMGWMHAFGGDDVPLNDARFLAGSDTFTIAGTPIADNAFAFDAGLRWQADPQVVIDASYVGRFASDVRDQGARVTLNWTF